MTVPINAHDPSCDVYVWFTVRETFGPYQVDGVHLSEEAARDQAEKPEPSFVRYEAEQMLALVNELRAEHGLTPATLERVRRIEQSAAGHSDYPDKYALRCAFLALGEED